ncbi:MAG: hypothetical protein NTU79_01410 [Planctomycetota bacterium]|nr:hypothetical protein [Planctomycetota bacterium]
MDRLHPDRRSGNPFWILVYFGFEKAVEVQAWKAECTSPPETERPESFGQKDFPRSMPDHLFQKIPSSALQDFFRLNWEQLAIDCIPNIGTLYQLKKL